VKINHGPGFAGNFYHAARRYAFVKPPDGRIGKVKGWFPGCVPGPKKPRIRVRRSVAKPVDPVTGKRPYRKRYNSAEAFAEWLEMLRAQQ